MLLKVSCVHINDQLVKDRCPGFLSSCGDFALVNEPLEILVVGQTARVLEVNIAGNLLGVYIKICVAFILTADFVTPINSATCSCFRCFSCRSCFSLADRLYIIVFTSSPCILSDMGFQLGDWRVTVYRQKKKTDIRAALESQIDKQTADEVSYMKEQLAEIIAQKDKLLDLYLSNMFSKEQLDEKAEPLKAEEERLQYAIKQLSRSNEEIQADIAAVDETIAYLQEQREIWRKEFKTISREEKIAGLESITVNPDGTLTFKQKGIEEVDRLVEKHQYLKYQSRRKVS